MLQGAEIKQRFKEYGMTAMEMIIVMTMILGILAMSSSNISGLFSASDATSNANNILALYTAARGFESGAGYGSDGTDLTKLLVETKSVPNGLVASESGITNQWHGVVKMPVTNNGYGFDIEYPNIPTSIATKLAWQLLGSGNFTSVGVGSTVITAPGTLDAVVNAISTGAASSQDKVTLTFSVNGATT